MSHKERVAVYIDGNNMYKRLKEIKLPDPKMRFDFTAFVDHLVGDRQLISKRYYVGTIKNFDNSTKGAKLVKKQQKFLAGIEREGFDIKLGRIMYDGNIREKGVDVKLGIDMVIGAADGIYDTAILITSDTDLIPAIKYIRNGKGKNVEYVGFSANPSLGMINTATPRIFSKGDIEQFQAAA